MNRIHIEPLAVAFIALAAASLGSAISGCNETNALHGMWIHSHEEDSAEVQVFRPEGYAFPPSRGREGWEILESAELVHHAIGMADAPTEERGTWQVSGDLLTVVLDGSIAARRYRIHQLDSTVLKLQIIR